MVHTRNIIYFNRKVRIYDLHNVERQLKQVKKNLARKRGDFMKLYISLFLSAFIIGLLALVTLSKVSATHIVYCHPDNGKYPYTLSGNNSKGSFPYFGNCVLHGNAQKECIANWCSDNKPEVPTVTPTPTIEITSTPTPTETPCNEDCDQVTPTASPTPTISPTPTSEPTACGNLGCGVGNVPSNPGQSGSYTPSVCDGIFPQAVLLQGFKRLTPTSVEFSFWGVTSDKYSVDFGYSESDLSMGIPYLPSTSTSFEIDGLNPNQMVWARVWSYNGKCRTPSVIVDP